MSIFNQQNFNSSVFMVALFFLLYFLVSSFQFGQLLYLLIKYLKLFTLRVYESNKKSIGHRFFQHQKMFFLEFVHFVIQEMFLLNTIALKKKKNSIRNQMVHNMLNYFQNPEMSRSFALFFYHLIKGGDLPNTFQMFNYDFAWS